MSPYQRHIYQFESSTVKGCETHNFSSSTTDATDILPPLTSAELGLCRRLLLLYSLPIAAFPWSRSTPAFLSTSPRRSSPSRVRRGRASSSLSWAHHCRWCKFRSRRESDAILGYLSPPAQNGCLHCVVCWRTFFHRTLGILGMRSLLGSLLETVLASLSLPWVGSHCIPPAVRATGTWQRARHQASHGHRAGTHSWTHHLSCILISLESS